MFATYDVDDDQLRSRVAAEMENVTCCQEGHADAETLLRLVSKISKQPQFLDR